MPSVTVRAKQMFTSNKKSWTTPANILDRVRKVFSIGLDPCDNAQSIVKPRVSFKLPKQDGLKTDWPKMRRGEGVFVNWPYGSMENKVWARKVVEEKDKGVGEIIALAAVCPSEIWFQDVIMVAKPTAFAFCHKRLRFSNANAVAPFASVVIYFGEDVDKFEKAFQDIAWVVKHPKRGTYPVGIHRVKRAKIGRRILATDKAKPAKPAPKRKPAVKAVAKKVANVIKKAAPKIVAKAPAPVRKVVVRVAPKPVAPTPVVVRVAPKPVAPAAPANGANGGVKPSVVRFGVKRPVVAGAS